MKAIGKEDTMAQTASTTVKDIYEFDRHLLHTKLVARIQNVEPTLQELKEFIEDMSDGKLNPSMGTVHNYRNKVKEALEEGVEFSELIDKRKKNGKIADIQDKQVSDSNILPMGTNAVATPQETGDKLTSVLQPLEEMIKKGAAGLSMIETVDPALMLKAISEYNKITGGANGGLTLSGLQQIALTVKAKEAADAEIIFKYIPEDQHEKVLAEMEQLENDFYDNLDLTEQGRQTKKVLEQLNVTI